MLGRLLILLCTTSGVRGPDTLWRVHCTRLLAVFYLSDRSFSTPTLLFGLRIIGPDPIWGEDEWGSARILFGLG